MSAEGRDDNRCASQQKKHNIRMRWKKRLPDNF